MQRVANTAQNYHRHGDRLWVGMAVEHVSVALRSLSHLQRAVVASGKDAPETLHKIAELRRSMEADLGVPTPLQCCLGLPIRPFSKIKARFRVQNLQRKLKDAPNKLKRSDQRCHG